MSAAHRRGKINRERGWTEEVPAIPVSKIDAELYGALREAEGDNALLINNQIHIGPFTLTSTGLQIQAGASEEEWSKIGELLFRLEGSIQWLIGDWLVYGEDVKWGDVKKLAEKLGRDEHTLYNYMAVCRGVKSSRRRELLSFSHHYEVMGLPEEDQEYALKHAEETKMALKPFRTWLREWQMAEKGYDKRSGLPLYGLVDVPESAWKGLRKLSQRDPFTYKPHEKEELLEYAHQLRAWIDELISKATHDV